MARFQIDEIIDNFETEVMITLALVMGIFRPWLTI